MAVDANAPHEGPEQRFITTDELFADLMQPGNPLIASELSVAQLSIDHIGPVTTPTRGGETEQATRNVQGYGPRLEKVVASVRGWEHEEANKGFSPGELDRKVFEFDSLLRLAADQPVVVMKPGKTWLDVGFLEKPQATQNNTGLQVFDALPNAPSSVQVPVRGSVTIDIRTGQHPEWSDQQEDQELLLRNQRQKQDVHAGHPTRPDINPLHTHLILSPADAEGIQVNSATAYILVGYPLVQHTLNKVLGFDPGRLDEAATSEKFHTADQMQQRLVQAGVKLDFDFIDGFLATRTKLFEENIARMGPLREVSGTYHGFLFSQLHQKYADLVSVGWISPVSQV